MKFKAVEFMRTARDQISKDIQGMSLQQEKEYLAKHSEWFTSDNPLHRSCTKTADHSADVVQR